MNDECERLEREIKERQEAELSQADGTPNGQINGEVDGSHDGRASPSSGEEEAPPKASNETSPTSDPTTNNDQPPPPPAPAAAPNKEPRLMQQQLVKKPNRQKARLARRAAEASAASAAAADEASSLPDQRATELSAMKPQIASLHLTQHDIRPDGHCLYSAFADSLRSQSLSLKPPTLQPTMSSTFGEESFKGDDAYRVVRRVAAEYVKQNGDEFAGFLEEDLDDYVKKVRETSEWGGQVELLALAKAYAVDVGIVQVGGVHDILGVEGKEGSKEDGQRKKVWLAYYRHSYGLGEHYNSLRKLD